MSSRCSLGGTCVRNPVTPPGEMVFSTCVVEALLQQHSILYRYIGLVKLAKQAQLPYVYLGSCRGLHSGMQNSLMHCGSLLLAT